MSAEDRLSLISAAWDDLDPRFRFMAIFFGQPLLGFVVAGALHNGIGVLLGGVIAGTTLLSLAFGVVYRT